MRSTDNLNLVSKHIMTSLSESPCLIMLMVSSVFGLCFGMHYLVSFLVCNHLDEEDRASYFALIVFLMSCYC